MKRLSLCVALGLALSALSALADDPLPRARPESVGMSSERLARIGRVINAHIEKNHLPGMVVAVARKGKLVYYEAFGWRDKEAGVRMTADTHIQPGLDDQADGRSRRDVAVRRGTPADRRPGRQIHP